MVWTKWLPFEIQMPFENRTRSTIRNPDVYILGTTSVGFQKTLGAEIPNAFWITMVTLFLVFQWCSVLNIMATTLFRFSIV